jgi:enoyl-CoA hydratase/carnithine racemase
MSTPTQGLLHTQQAGIATITLNHPERANALDPAEFHALAALLDSIGKQPDLRAIVLTGQGDRAFCAGLNLGNAEAIREDIASSGPTGLGQVLRVMTALPVPILGRINGACVAGGMGLLGACDFALASTNARFGLPEIRHGLYPFVALAGLHGRAAPALLDQLAESGTFIDSEAALEASLVDSIWAPDALDAALAAELARLDTGKPSERLRNRLALGPESVGQRVFHAESSARQASKPSTVDSLDATS